MAKKKTLLIIPFVIIMTVITIVDSALIVGLVLFVMLYTIIEMLATPLPVTKYEITKSSKDIVNDKSTPA